MHRNLMIITTKNFRFSGLQM